MSKDTGLVSNIPQSLDDSAGFWTASPADVLEHLPEQIGSYKITGLLGVGGMGIVYLAQQEEPGRQVAIKVVNSTHLTKESKKRFHREIQILSQVRNPGIAQIYDAGTETIGHVSIPYFVMEYIEGSPLTTYVRENVLSANQRLSLLIKICRSVEYAHKMGIIHRDLKPANILITKDGQPKILDFGVARVTESDMQVTTLQTNIGQLVGTIPYMSPEQACGNPLDLDHRTDIYSLGVMGYELLTGKLPHDLHHYPIPEALRIIRDSAPLPLSSINQTFRGDLNTIILKAIEKDRLRRYATISEFADDIECFIKNKPISARPPSHAYIFRKYVKRNRTVFIALCAVMLTLVIGIAATTTQAIRATAQSKRAEAEAATHQEISKFLQDMLSSIRPEKTRGQEVTVRQVIDEAAEKLNHSLKDRPIVRATLHRTIGSTYQTIGELKQAEHHLRQTYEIRKNRLGMDHPHTLAAASYLGNILKEMGKIHEAEPILRDALEIAKRVEGIDGVDTLTLMNSLGNVTRVLGKTAETEKLYRATYKEYIKKHGVNNKKTLIAMNNLGVLLMENLKQLDEAEQLLHQCMELRTSLLGDDHPDTIYSMSNLAVLYNKLNKTDDALEMFTKTLELSKRVLGYNHPQTLRRAKNFAMSLAIQGKLDQAEKIIRQIYTAQQEQLGDIHPDTINSLGLFVNILIEHKKLQEAIPLVDRCYQSALKQYGPDHDEILRSATLYVDLYEALGNKEKQDEWFEKIKNTKFDPNAKNKNQ